MSRSREPVGKLSRRLGIGLTEKGQRILAKRPYPPGQHGQAKVRRKVSEYGKRLLEKQKARFLYGLQERQFRNLFEKASRHRGSTGETLLILLERRLDNVVYRMGLARTRAQARQLVNHGHVSVDGRKTDIASFSVKLGQVISVRPEKRALTYYQNLLDGGTLKQHQAPIWLELDNDKLSAKVVAYPTRQDAEPGISEQLIVEFYSR
jgi:small subunit ribosomal protein S4